MKMIMKMKNEGEKDDKGVFRTEMEIMKHQKRENK